MLMNGKPIHMTRLTSGAEKFGPDGVKVDGTDRSQVGKGSERERDQTKSKK